MPTLTDILVVKSIPVLDDEHQTITQFIVLIIISNSSSRAYAAIVDVDLVVFVYVCVSCMFTQCFQKVQKTPTMCSVIAI